jgi:hypothetical protein
MSQLQRFSLCHNISGLRAAEGDDVELAVRGFTDHPIKGRHARRPSVNTWPHRRTVRPDDFRQSVRHRIRKRPLNWGFGGGPSWYRTSDLPRVRWLGAQDISALLVRPSVVFAFAVGKVRLSEQWAAGATADPAPALRATFALTREAVGRTFAATAGLLAALSAAVGAVAGATQSRLIQYAILDAAIGVAIQAIAVHGIQEGAVRPVVNCPTCPSRRLLVGALRNAQCRVDENGSPHCQLRCAASADLVDIEVGIGRGFLARATPAGP